MDYGAETTDSLLVMPSAVELSVSHEKECLSYSLNDKSLTDESRNRFAKVVAETLD